VAIEVTAAAKEVAAGIERHWGPGLQSYNSAEGPIPQDLVAKARQAIERWRSPGEETNYSMSAIEIRQSSLERGVVLKGRTQRQRAKHARPVVACGVDRFRKRV